MSTIDIKTKIEAYTRYTNSNGTLSQSTLADDYGISPRTLRRWFDDAAAELGKARPKAAPKASKKPAKAKPKAKPKAEPKTEVAKEVVQADVPAEPVVHADVIAPEPEVQTGTEYTYVMTAKSVSMTKIVAGKVVDTVSIDKTNDVFKTVVSAIMESDEDTTELERAYMLCRPRTMIEVISEGRVLIDIKANRVYYVPDPENEPDVKVPVDSGLAGRILEMIRKDGPDAVKSLVLFLDKLLANPSYRAVNELWKFLSHNDIEIAADGDFYAFKVVTGDFMDKHTRTMSNAIGAVVKMPRNLVDENSHNTCSAGLHVCARHYIKSFASGTDKIVRVKVSPTDVVSIPKDYNDSKMRCCRYIVEGLAK